MAETLLSFGVEKLWDFLVRESDRFRGVDKQLTELKSNLNLLRCFLKDADAKKNASELVRNCVEEIKEIVFDAEDIIETFILKEELSKTSSIKKHMRRLSCIIVDHKEIASDLGGISKRISKVTCDMQNFGVHQMIVDRGEYSHPLQERLRQMRKTYPTNNENNPVGLEKNVEKLVSYLVEEDNIQVVSITGMGGIGKTTLARQVFNREMVKSHFDGVEDYIYARLPDEQHFPSHVTTLSLQNCGLEEDPMPILEKLLQLKEVSLLFESFSGKRMVCSGGGFPQLQKLELCELEEWEEWIVEEGSMPLLHTLTISFCDKLKELPDGLRFITSLKELNIFGTPLEFNEKLCRGGEDFYKVQHIPLLNIELIGEEESDSD